MADDLLALAHELSQRGEPFVLATVVRCERPTSAKPGAKALIRKDGSVSGWIGGGCAEPVVVKEGLAALRDGRPRFIVLVGQGGAAPGRREGVLEYPMTCHSGGTLEIFIEPVTPKPHLLLVGKGPVVETLARLAKAMECPVTVVSSESSSGRLPPISATPETCIVVTSHGAFDEEAVEQALQSEAGYVSLVASRKRAGVIIDALRARGVPAGRLSRLKAPAGLDIGAITPDEIAVSILAEVIQVSRNRKGERHQMDAASADPPGTEARDPVCGMSVDIASAKYRSERSGSSYYFCCARCQQLFDQDFARYAGQRPTR